MYAFLEILMKSLLHSGLPEVVEDGKTFCFISETSTRIHSDVALLCSRYHFVHAIHGVRPRTLFQNFIDCLSDGVKKADWIFILQDDTYIARNCFLYMDWVIRNIPQSTGILSFFTHYTDTRSWPYLFWPYPAILLDGAQALLFNRFCADEFLQSRARREHESLPKNKGDYITELFPHKQIDYCLRRYLIRESNYRLFGHNPCLVQHTGGNTSSVDNVGDRLSPNFIGRDSCCMYMLNEYMDRWENFVNHTNTFQSEKQRSRNSFMEWAFV
jgi:hypothetical protein